MALSQSSFQRISTSHAALALGCTNATVLHYAKRGELRCYALANGRYLFDLSDVLALRNQIRSRGPRRGRPMIGKEIAARRSALAVEAVTLIQGGDNAAHS